MTTTYSRRLWTLAAHAVAVGLLFTQGIAPVEAVTAATMGDLKSVLAIALDKDDVPMRGLQPADFVVFEDGQQREVTEVTPATDPLYIALMIDTAKSPMGVVEPTRDVRAGLLAFVQSIYAAQPDAQISLTEFGGAGVLLRNFTSKQDDMEKSIKRVNPSLRSSAVALEALYDAAKDISKKPGPRRVIVMVDMGSNDTSGIQPSKVSEAVQLSGASVWSVSIQGPQAVTAPGRDTALEFLTEATGGLRFTALMASSLEDQLKHVADILTSQYVVTYSSPGPAAQSVVPAALKAAKTLRAPWRQ